MIRESAIYAGTLSHARRVPRPHAFSYRLHMLYLDLDELPEILAAGGPLRRGRLGLLSFRREDYLAGGPDLAEAARDLVRRELGVRPAGPVRLLTHPRSFGYVFNPVSFYYCHAPAGGLEAVVAEITNTPWGERHAYVLPAGEGGARARFAKRFHVSPFFGMSQGYAWDLGAPGERLEIDMRNEEGGAEVFRARLSLARRPWSAAALRKAALLEPAMALRVHAAIYWQALRLWVKGEPFHVHPAKRAAPAARRS
ncbi:MAG TPA: DUF1365 domain-containing protein [Anaeromyxobacter sp.]